MNEYSTYEIATKIECFATCNTDQKTSISAIKETNEHGSILTKITSWRWRVAYLALTGLITQIIHRNCISLAIVCITNALESYHEQSQNISNASSVQMTRVTVSWDSHTQGIILSSYFYGQLISPFLSGIITQRYGVKWPMAIYTFLSSALLATIPAAARMNTNLVVVIRVLQGFLGSGCLPMYSQLWKEWAPVTERSELMAFTFSGLDLGVLVAFMGSGVICLIPLDNGWPFIFYIFGGLSVLWTCVWLVCFTDSPKEHPWITNSELIYITGNKPERQETVENVGKVPWKLILTSRAVWAMISAMFTVAYGMTVVFSYLPRYMNDILDFDISKNGVVSALPFLGRSVSIIIIGMVTDKILRCNLVSTTLLRKINQCTASVLGAITIFFVGYVDKSQSWIAILLITLSAAVLGGTMSGSYTNALELAPRYASTISGLAFTLNAVGHLIAPIITAWMTAEGTHENWKHTFMSVAAVYLIGAVMYGLFGSSDTLPKYKELTMEIISENTSHTYLKKNISLILDITNNNDFLITDKCATESDKLAKSLPSISHNEQFQTIEYMSCDGKEVLITHI